MTDINDEGHDTGYELVIPFVTCKSQGGPHDDASFVAGWEASQLEQLLSSSPGVMARTTHNVMIHTSVVPLAELLAMRYGWTITDSGELTDDDGSATVWSVLTLDRGAPDDEL